MKFSRIFEPHVVVTPHVQTTSLMPSGMPVSGRHRPAAMARSAAAACSSAAASTRVRNAPTLSSTAAILPSTERVNSTAQMSLFLRSRWASEIVSS